LAGTTVKGNVVVSPNATLVAGAVRIGGDVQARRAKSVSVTVESRVGGTVRVDASARAVVTESRVAGSIRLRWNRGPVSIARAQVDGDVQLLANVGRSMVSRNDVAGDLLCTANRPPPTGGANTVAGDKKGQCARL
jgi:hypothetical protein